MAWNGSDTRLRDVLAEIYWDVENAKRLARDAQLDVTLINFSGSSKNFCKSIIDVAEKNGKLSDLIQQARKEYPGNEKLSNLAVIFARTATQNQGSANIPRLLLYLPNRNEHESQIKASLQEFKHNRNRHLVYIMHGDEDQSHDMFLERMQMQILPQWLTVASQEIVVKNYLIRWLNSYRNTKQLERWLLQQLSEEVDPAHRENRSHINRAFARHLGPVMIQSHVMTSDWFNTSPLEAFLHFWNNWPSQPSAYPLILCLSITYQDTSQMGWWWSRQRRKYQQQNGKIKEELETLDRARYRNLHLTILPPLNDVTRGDVENWARRSEVRQLGPLDKLLNDIRDLFKGREAIAMNALAHHLEEILSKQATQS